MALLPNLAIQSVSAYFDYTIYYAVFIACFCGIADLLFFNIFIYFKALEQIKSKLYYNMGHFVAFLPINDTVGAPNLSVDRARTIPYRFLQGTV
jgi:hypothetical protein